MAATHLQGCVFLPLFSRVEGPAMDDSVGPGKLFLPTRPLHHLDNLTSQTVESLPRHLVGVCQLPWGWGQREYHYEKHKHWVKLRTVTKSK